MRGCVQDGGVTHPAQRTATSLSLRNATRASVTATETGWSPHRPRPPLWGAPDPHWAATQYKRILRSAGAPTPLWE